MYVAKPEMTDAQFRAVSAVEQRGADNVVRFRDTRTVATLIAMAKPARGWVALVWATVDNQRRIVSATLTEKGRKVYAREVTRRGDAVEQQRQLDKILALRPAVAPQGPLASLTADADPFALIATGRPAEAPIPF